MFPGFGGNGTTEAFRVGVRIDDRQVQDWAERARQGAAVRAGLDQAARHMERALSEYPARRYVSRRAAYGRTFFSAKQQRYFFYALNEGIIRVPYQRTGALQRSWRRVAGTMVGGGYDVRLENTAPHARFTLDSQRQSRHERAVGWQTYDQVAKREAPRVQMILIESMMRVG